MKRLAVLPVLLLVLLGISCEAKPRLSVNQQIAIRVAVFKKLLPETKARVAPEVYFLAISGKNGWQNPGKSIMAYFRNSKLCIKPFMKSDCEVSIRGVRDKATDKKAAVISEEAIIVISKTKVEVAGFYYGNKKAHSGYHFTLELKNKKWIVVKQTPLVFIENKK